MNLVFDRHRWCEDLSFDFKMFYFVVLVLAAVSVSGNVLHNGKCPELSPVANFNSTAYQGMWYEISKYPHEADAAVQNDKTSGKCSTLEYRLDGQNIKIKKSHVSNGIQNSVELTANAPDTKNAGKLMITGVTSASELAKDSPLTILATDYTNYAVIYSCSYDEKNKNHQDLAWILSRSKKLEGDAKTAVDSFVKATSELDATMFRQTDFSDDACKFTSISATSIKPTV